MTSAPISYQRKIGRNPAKIAQTKTNLRYGQLKPKLRAVIVMQDGPESIFLQRLAEFPNTNSHLVENNR